MAQKPPTALDNTSYICCKTYIPVSRTSFTWVIENVNFCRKGVGNAFESPKFNDWKLKLYPNGKSNNDYYVGLFLISYAYRERTVKYKMYVLNNKNKETCTFSNTVFFRQHNEQGNANFIQITDFFSETSGIQVNGAVRICCEVEEAGERQDLMGNCNYGLELSKLSEELLNIFTSSRLTDVSIVVEEKEFKVHKLILSARSSVFASMFEHDLAEKRTNVIQISDSRSEIIEAVLHYIYSGKCSLVKDKAAEILPVADKYNLNELRNLCEQTLKSNLDLNNFTSFLILSEMHNLDQLKSAAMEYFILKEKDLMKTGEWQCLVESHPQLVAQLFSRKMGENVNIILHLPKTK